MMLSYRNKPIDQVIKKITSLYKQLYDTDIRGRAYLTIDGYQLPHHYILSELVEDNALLHLQTDNPAPVSVPENNRLLRQPEHHLKHNKPAKPSSSPVREEPPKTTNNNKKRQRPEKPDKPPQKKKKPEEEEQTESRPQPSSKLLSLFNAPIKKEPSAGVDEDISSDDSVFITHEEPQLPKGKPNLFRS